ncbi:MAG: hypothetical protein U9R74_17675 [Pseudomonadota bacterium]|nr:hypothetical protein [Pseudomonadota bacterium]
MRNRYSRGRSTRLVFTLTWVALVLVGLTACSSTKLVTQWKDDQYGGPAFSSIFIVGMVKDDVSRRYLEDALAARMDKDGVKGIPGYRLLPTPVDLDEESEIREAVGQTDADAVLIVTLTGVDKQERVVPPRVEYVPAMGMGYGMYPYYMSSYQAVYQPGYTTIDTIIGMEQKLFSVASEELVWAGKTECVNPSSRDKVVGEMADVLMINLTKSGLVK